MRILLGNRIVGVLAESRLPGLQIFCEENPLAYSLLDSEFTGVQREEALVHADAADPTRSVTKSQLRTLVKRTAHTFRTNYGIGKSGPNEDVVLCISTGHYLLPTIFYATVAAGGIYSSSAFGSTSTELAGQIEQVEPKLLVCSADVKDVAIAAAKSAGLPLDRVVVFGHSEGLWLAQALTGVRVPLSTSLLDWPRITDAVALANSTICLIFSSGTTGKPKAVQLSHANMVAQSHIPVSLSRAYLEREKPGVEYRTLAHLPASHIAGIQIYFVNAVYHGGVVYWMPRFDLEGFLKYNKRHRITNLFSVPPIYLLITKSPLVTDQFDNLEHAVTGAAPMGKELQAAAMGKLGKGRPALAQTWGMSETAGSVTHMPRGMSDDTGSVGVILSNHEMRIVDDTGKDVEPGEPGELLVRGPVVMKGYHKNEQASKDAFVNGWFCTGDIGYFKNGRFYIVDRKKVRQDRELPRSTRLTAPHTGTYQIQRPSSGTSRARGSSCVPPANTRRCRHRNRRRWNRAAQVWTQTPATSPLGP